MRSIFLGGRAPLLATQPVPWPPRAETAIDLAGLTFVTPFDLVGLGVLVAAAPPEVGLTVVPPTDPNVCAYLQYKSCTHDLELRVEVDNDLPLNARGYWSQGGICAQDTMTITGVSGPTFTTS